MSDNIPNSRDADDAKADDAPPTDAASDEVKADAAHAEDHADASDDGEGDGGLADEELGSPT